MQFKSGGKKTWQQKKHKAYIPLQKLIINVKDLCLPKQILTCEKYVYC